ncbi:CotH kinase family protein [Anaerotignum lactatifermentans]|uniref:CotH kinase family protein n=1 Tax=Anaerotignum lactatifermentans TaxID=160404 RepID=UPI002670D310|nr:CotH kinase family protein [Anaerotignum lactatifermentans]
MKGLREYKFLLLSGLALVVFAFLVFGIASREDAEAKEYLYLDNLFAEGVVNEINIEISEEDWADLVENPLEETYYAVDVTINGETLSNVALRTKGNNTLTSVASSDSDRYSFKIDFDYFNDGENYYGLKKLNLNNNYGDASYMREYISYRIMGEMGIPVPATSYTHITINGEEWGLYLAVEPIDEVFLERTFGDSTGDLYKPDGTGADLVYRGDDMSEYPGLVLKTNEETSDGSAILDLMKALESGEGMEDVLDVDEVLRYLAANVALANYDSYLGNTTHNYYLYEQDGRFTIVPWDYNYSFGGFGGGEVDIYEPTNQSMGMGGGRRGDMENAEAQTAAGEDAGEEQTAQMPEGMERPEGMGGGMGGSNEKPLVDTLLSQDALLAQYESYLAEIAETYFTEAYMSQIVSETAEMIAPYVEKDATAFFTYDEFLEASSVDATDPNSLVYFAVSMAESIENQLAGGEPTFNTSSFVAAAAGGGKRPGGDFGDMQETTAEMEQVADGTAEGQTQRVPEQMGDMAGQPPEMTEGTEQAAGDTAEKQFQRVPGDLAGESPEMTEGTEQTADTAQSDTAEANDQTQKSPEQMGDMPQRGEQGQRGGGPMGAMSRVTWQDAAPILAVCGGIFLLGFGYLLYFRRRRRLSMPKQEEKTDTTE